MPTDKDFDFGGGKIEETSIDKKEIPSDNESTNHDAPKSRISEPSTGKGNRTNAATVQVRMPKGEKSPIVILFGPSMCGKTMTLVRLTRYLSSRYTFKPDKSFKDSSDDEYNALCSNFNAAVNSDNAAEGTSYIDFMLLRVNEKPRGNTFCQFVESPGEFLFDPEKPDEQFPLYFEAIRDTENRKIWVFFLEPTLSNEEKRAYVNKITQRIEFGEEDRFIFLVNKIDMEVTKDLMISKERINEEGLREYVDQEFEDLTTSEKFIRHRTWLGDKELFKIVGFQTGTYHEGEDADGKKYKAFHAGHNSHPQRLWDAIEGAVKGDW